MTIFLIQNKVIKTECGCVFVHLILILPFNGQIFHSLSRINNARLPFLRLPVVMQELAAGITQICIQRTPYFVHISFVKFLHNFK